MPAPRHERAIANVEDTAPVRTGPPGPRRPSRLGLVLAACLLIGLLLWRHVIPDATPWLDVAALTAAWAFLLALGTLRRK